MIAARDTLRSLPRLARRARRDLPFVGGHGARFSGKMTAATSSHARSRSFRGLLVPAATAAGLVSAASWFAVTASAEQASGSDPAAPPSKEGADPATPDPAPSPTPAPPPTPAATKKKGAAKKDSSKTDSNKTPSKELLHGRRTILLFGKVDNKMATEIVTNLFYLDSVSSEPITILINSTGGIVTDGFAVYDAIRMLSSPVNTVVIGKAYSMATVILAAGTKGRRFATPNARIMVHEASGSSGTKQVSRKAQDARRKKWERSNGRTTEPLCAEAHSAKPNQNRRLTLFSAFLRPCNCALTDV